jgi:hypothetical protein
MSSTRTSYFPATERCILVTNLLSAMIGGLALALALNHLGLRGRGPHIVDGLAMFALSIWYGVAVLLPFGAVGYALVGGVSLLAPEPHRLIAASAGGAVVAVALVYVSLRLWFAAPQSLTVGRIQLYRSWPLTKGRALPILGYGLATLIAAIAPTIAYAASSFILPAPEWIESFEDALTQWTLAHLILTELSFVLGAFYFSAATAFLFDRMMSPPATEQNDASAG